MTNANYNTGCMSDEADPESIKEIEGIIKYTLKVSKNISLHSSGF